jgi:hypothetical protein
MLHPGYDAVEGGWFVAGVHGLPTAHDFRGIFVHLRYDPPARSPSDRKA